MLVALGSAMDVWAVPPPPEASAPEVIVQMNDALLDAIRVSSTPPPLASRHIAMVNVAMFDAVNGIMGGYEPYSFFASGPPRGYPTAAAAAAARTVINELYPSEVAHTDDIYDDVIDTMPSVKHRRQGIIFGIMVGDNLLGERDSDGWDAVVPYTPSSLPGRWQPTPPDYATDPGLPQWGSVTPWALAQADQFRPAGPPALDSDTCALAWFEVYTYGRDTSTLRTVEQTEIAQFWADGAGTATPPGHWIVITEDIALLEGWALDESARAFALVSLALADAAIAAWDTKYAYDAARPVSAIQEQADDYGHPMLQTDPSWLPLLVTPSFPEYASGHSTFSSAAATVLAGVLGTDAYVFTTVAEEPAVLGVARTFDALSDAASEAGQSRVYGGIHFQFGNQDGLVLGELVGQEVLDTQLLPVGP
jgi:membrane-associated phospholipid phosphatase